MQLLGLDCGRYPQPREVQEVVLATGNRADLLVTASPGTSPLRALPYDRGTMMGMPGMGGANSPMSSADRQEIVLATLDVAGTPAVTLAPVPAQRAPRDLRGAAVAARRDLTFAIGMGPGGMRFTIDGKRFDPSSKMNGGWAGVLA